MRITLTLDDDMAAKLKAEAKRSGLSLRDLVNSTLRRGLVNRPPSRPRPLKRFSVEARDLGELAPGLSLDNVASVMERLERPLHG